MTYTAYSSDRDTPSAHSGEVPGVMQLRAQWRARVLPTLHGDVLDVGAGDGTSLHYMSALTSIALLEPHSRSVRRLRARAGNRPRARVLHAGAEQIPMPDASVDAAVCCAVLCSVADQDRALGEIWRVLRPGGQLVLLEHVAAARGTWLRRGQRMIAPFSRWFDRGCDPARDTEAALTRSGLEAVEMRRIKAAGPWGTAFPHLAAVLTRPPSHTRPPPPRQPDPVGHARGPVTC